MIAAFTMGLLVGLALVVAIATAAVAGIITAEAIRLIIRVIVGR